MAKITICTDFASDCQLDPSTGDTALRLRGRLCRMLVLHGGRQSPLARWLEDPSLLPPHEVLFLPWLNGGQFPNGLKKIKGNLPQVYKWIIYFPNRRYEILSRDRYSTVFRFWHRSIWKLTCAHVSCISMKNAEQKSKHKATAIGRIISCEQK